MISRIFSDVSISEIVIIKIKVILKINLNLNFNPIDVNPR